MASSWWRALWFAVCALGFEAGDLGFDAGFEGADATARAGMLGGWTGEEAAARLGSIAVALDDGDAEVRDLAMLALERAGSVAAGVFAGVLSEPGSDARARRLAARGLGALGRSGFEAGRSAFLEACGDDDGGVRGAALGALAACGVLDEEVAGRLRAGLREEAVGARVASARGLAASGALAAGALGDLAAAYRRAESDVEKLSILDAIGAAARHREEDAEALAGFYLEALTREGAEGDVAGVSARALTLLAALEGEGVAEALGRALDSEEAERRIWACRGLAAFGRKGRVASEALHRLLGDEDVRARRAAGDALRVIEGS